MRCDALLLDQQSRSDTYPSIEIDEEKVDIGHEATVSKVSDEQLFYLQSRGLTETELEVRVGVHDLGVVDRAPDPAVRRVVAVAKVEAQAER